MSEQYGYPLTHTDWVALQRIDEIVRKTLPLCEKAGRCGVNVEGQSQTLRMMGDFATQVKQEFFPNGAPGM